MGAPISARKPQAPKRMVAVEIAAAAVRAVEVELGADGARVVKRGEAPLSPTALDDAQAHRAEVAQAIKSSLSAAGISASQVVAAIPRRLVTVKLARLPHAEPDQIRGMVQFEAQQYVPFPLDEVVLGHEVVSDDTDEMTHVMIAAARRTLVEGVLAAFDSLSLVVVRLTVSSLGLAEHARGNMNPVALLDLEQDSMDLAVVVEGRMVFSRSATLPPTADSDTQARSLAMEIGRSLAAYQNENRSHPVSSVLIGGAATAEGGVESSLSGLLEVPVARMNGSLLAAANPALLPYATAIGAAVGYLRSGAGGIDLIPASRAEKKAAARRRVNAAAGMVVVVAALVLVGLGVSRGMADRAKQHEEDVKANRDLDAFQAVIKRARTDHDQIATTYKTVVAGLGRDHPTVDVLKALSDAVPAKTGVHLTQFAYDRTGTVSIRGSAASETAATDLVLALQGSKTFSEVRLSYLGDAQTEAGGASAANPAGVTARAKPGENMSFIIACRLTGVAPPPAPALPRPGRAQTPAVPGGSQR